MQGEEEADSICDMDQLPMGHMQLLYGICVHFNVHSWISRFHLLFEKMWVIIELKTLPFYSELGTLK